MFRYQIILLVVKIVWGFNINTENPALLQPDSRVAISEDSSRFFGYEIAYGFGSDDALNFVVTSPKSNLTPSQQKMYRCSSTGFFSRNPSCISIPSPDGINNSSGLSVSVQDNLDILACYPNMIHSCINQELVPGFCYQTTNEGRRWERLLPERGNVCPTTSSLDLDVIFLLDGSSSLGSNGFETIKEWIQEVSTQFNIEDGSAKIGVIQYSTITRSKDLFRIEITLGSITDRSTFNERVSSLEYLRGKTYTAGALVRSVPEFRASERFGRANSSQALVLITDGRASDNDTLSASARYVRSLGIKIFAVGVGEANIEQLQEIATGSNTNESVYFVDNFNALNGIAGELREVIRSFALEGDASAGSLGRDPANELELGQKGFASRLSRKPTKFGEGKLLGYFCN